MILPIDVKPWMLEPATKIQKEFILDMCRVLNYQYNPDEFNKLTKLEASNFITKYKPKYREMMEEYIKSDEYPPIEMKNTPTYGIPGAVMKEACNKAYNKAVSDVLTSLGLLTK